MSPFSRSFGRDALVRSGPTIPIVVSIPDRWVARLRSAGLSAPPSIAGDALLDTGSSVTAIDVAVADALQLPILNTEVITTPMGQAIQHAYPAQVAFPDGDLPDLLADDFIGADLRSFGVLMLIGRNVLARWHVSYDGPEGVITVRV